MLRERSSLDLSEFLRFLTRHPDSDGGLPPLSELSRSLGVSLAALREQLEVARALGLVEVRPRTGTRRLPFSFAPAVSRILSYAIALDAGNFDKYAQLRNHLEAAFWDDAVQRLRDEDKQDLQLLITRAEHKLGSIPVQVPHEEHRLLHLLIYRRLDNPFVLGILEAYWDAYEAIGLNLYAGSIDYLHEVWKYHAHMVQGICSGDYAAGRAALLAHVDLLAQRP